MELVSLICAEKHGHAAPSPEHRDLERWGYIYITHARPDGYEYTATEDGRKAERTWRELKEPE
jgi:hypothetical protein